MTELLIVLGVILLGFLLASMILRTRDDRRARRPQQLRPLEEQINDIRQSAISSSRQLQEILDHRSPPPETAACIAQLIDYFKKMEALAAASDASAKEIQQIADEAEVFVKQRRLKGIIVDLEIKQLAELVRKRNTGRGRSIVSQSF